MKVKDALVNYVAAKESFTRAELVLENAVLEYLGMDLSKKENDSGVVAEVICGDAVIAVYGSKTRPDVNVSFYRVADLCDVVGALKYEIERLSATLERCRIRLGGHPDHPDHWPVDYDPTTGVAG